MKLISLQIERFGARSNLQLEQLSERLNVVYGPNGSGKTTIIHFLRWMLFGSQDGGSLRYAHPGDSRVGGSLIVRDGAGRQQTVTRHGGGLYQDQVRITSGESDLGAAYDPRRLTGVDLLAYQHAFSFSFDQPLAIEPLLRVAQGHGLSLTHEEQQQLRLRELVSRLEDLRRAAAGFGADERSVAGWMERKRHILDELELAEQRRFERQRDWERELDQLTADIQSLRRQIDDLEAALRRLDNQWTHRTREAEEAAEAAQQQRERWLETRRQELAKIEEQIQQWHQVLERIRQRHEVLQSQGGLIDLPPAIESPLDEQELRAVLRSLGHTLDDIEQDLRETDSLDEEWDSRLRQEALRQVTMAAWQAMRNDVQRMSRELQRQRLQADYHEHSREMDHLRRCEGELLSLIEALDKRRISLRSQPELTLPEAGATSVYGHTSWNTLGGAATGFGTSAHWSTPPYTGNGQPGAWRSAYESRTPAVNPYDVRAPWETPLHWTTRGRDVDPVWEARLQHLARRREHLVARIRELENDLQEMEQRRDAWQHRQPSRDEERQVELLRAELQQIDERMRNHEAWLRRREEMEVLERQIQQLREQLAPSEILREASMILHRLTDGAMRAIRVNDRLEVWIDDDHGRALGYNELSRGTRDQTYLALALAIVAAFRRRQIELPLVLNDVFINIDAERTQATAEVLAQFASQGHQVILFTHHEHIMQRFSHLHAKLYSLRERTRPVAESVSQELYVRPLPRLEPTMLDQPAPATLDAVPRATSNAWVSHWESPYRAVVERATVDAVRGERRVVERTSHPETHRPLLTEDSQLVHAESIDRAVAQALRPHEIVTIRQFLHWAPEDLTRHLSDLGVTPATVYRWQCELSLQCYVGLSPADAALLVECGVDDPEELSYVDVSELHRRIEQKLNSQDARSRFGSIARFERSRLSRWIQAARRSHFRRRPTSRLRTNGAPARSIERPTTNERTIPLERTTASPERAASVETRLTRPRRPEPTRSRMQTAVATPESQEEPREPLRFFLTPTDPIVDAPSIGPKTAERFHGIGIETVDDFLRLDPQGGAERIDYRRITPDLIRSWQQQTALVCQVPNLRGHDAQILVACDVVDAQQLSRQNPDALSTVVQRFVHSAEGKRLLRGAKLPDAAEITNWVRWAKQALRAG